MKNTIQKRIFPFVLLLSLLAVLLCLAACDANEKNSVQTTQSAETGDTSHEHRCENTVVPPSCTEGYTLHVCTECGYSYTDTYTDALGHQFTDVRNNVDCNACQTVTHTCLVCGYSYTEETQDRGTIHSMEPKTVVYPTQTAGGYTIFVCSRCGITENRDLTNPVNYSTGLQYTTYSGVTYVTGLGTCTDTDIVIPTVNEKGQRVAGLFDHAFGNAQLCSGIRSVTVPETSVIRPAAFSGCRNLVSLTIPLTYSLGDLFSYQQTPVNFPATITTVNIVGATLKEGIHLSGCPTLERVTLDERIREIPANFFSGCAALSDIRFSNSLSKIGDRAFYGTAIRSFTVPNAVTSIPYGAFAECKQLTAVNFHSGVRSIGQEAFYRCTRLASLELPTSLTTLGMTAFSGCTSLKTVEIPPSLTDLPEFAFSYCSSLSEIILHDSIRSIGLNRISAVSQGRWFTPRSFAAQALLKPRIRGETLTTGSCTRENISPLTTWKVFTIFSFL
ncbi:MAG: leucine-rich repeat domain-containing protein, partial [Clostridia bacterium]|nr:leucine-rich repeat domain-containing protein [Clostridia bacterium]